MPSSVVLLALGSVPAHAFVGAAHEKATVEGLPFLRDEVLEDLVDRNHDQDSGDANDDDARHFDHCRFAEGAQYIDDQLVRTGDALEAGDPWTASEAFGLLTHPIQDLYAHSNWVNLLVGDRSAVDGELGFESLFDQSPGKWVVPVPLHQLRGDIFVGELPDPAGSRSLAPWTGALGPQSVIPTITQGKLTERLVVTHWGAPDEDEPGGPPACPDLRVGTVVDQYSAPMPFGIPGRMPRETALVHGSAPFPGESRPCADNYPEWVCLNKDDDQRPHYPEAMLLAKLQTGQAWCQALTNAHQTYGDYQAAGTAMTLWADPDKRLPYPDASSCGRAPDGPVEVRVTLRSVGLKNPSSSGTVELVSALFTGDFGQVGRAVAHTPASSRSVTVGIPMSLCVDPTDNVAVAIGGFLDRGDHGFDPDDGVLHGWTGEIFPWSQDFHVDTPSLTADFGVERDVTDVDGDGLSACAEAFHGTSDTVRDSDGDGGSDGDEVDCGTNPTDPKSHLPPVGWCSPDTFGDWDGDGLFDQDESVWGLDAFDPDSDGDELPDGADPSWIGDLVLAASEMSLVVPKGTDPEGFRKDLVELVEVAEIDAVNGRWDLAATDLDEVKAGFGCGDKEPAEVCAAVDAWAAAKR